MHIHVWFATSYIDLLAARISNQHWVYSCLHILFIMPMAISHFSYFYQYTATWWTHRLFGMKSLTD